MQAVPLTPPAGTSILSLTATINGVSLVPSSGSAQNLNLPTPFEVDFTRIQSDSVLLGTLSAIPAGTYKITVSLSAPVLYYCTQPNPGTQGCLSGSVTKFTGAVSTPSVPNTITLSANQKTGLALIFNLQNAITTNASQAVTGINFAAANALTSISLPSSVNTLTAGQLDFVEDVTGVVSSATASSQTLTISTAARGPLTAVANSNTVYSPNCAVASFSGCVKVGQVASVDAALNSNGTVSIIEFDPISSTSVDIVEGVVTSSPSSPTQFQLVANDLVFASSGSRISGSLSSLLGAPVNITLVAPVTPFTVDTKGLTTPVSTFPGGTDTSVLLPGQTVAVTITSFTAASGNVLASASSNFLMLRFTRLSGNVQTAGGPVFSIQSLAPFFGQTTAEQVQLTLGTPPSASTNFDGVNPSTTPLNAGQTVSVRALYFGPTVTTPFSAAKVRVP
jgi:hypothetical protein